MTDVLVSALSEDGLLRALYAQTSELCGEAIRRHKPDTVSRIALERALTSVALIPMSWKDADRVCVQWLGQGPLGGIVAEARLGGKIRGYPSRPHAIPGFGRASRFQHDFMSILMETTFEDFWFKSFPARAAPELRPIV